MGRSAVVGAEEPRPQPADSPAIASSTSERPVQRSLITDRSAKTRPLRRAARSGTGLERRVLAVVPTRSMSRRRSGVGGRLRSPPHAPPPSPRRRRCSRPRPAGRGRRRSPAAARAARRPAGRCRPAEQRLVGHVDGTGDVPGPPGMALLPGELLGLARVQQLHALADRPAHLVEVDQPLSRAGTGWGGSAAIGATAPASSGRLIARPGSQAAVQQVRCGMAVAAKHPHDAAGQDVEVVVVGDHHGRVGDAQPGGIGGEHGRRARS